MFSILYISILEISGIFMEYFMWMFFLIGTSIIYNNEADDICNETNLDIKLCSRIMNTPSIERNMNYRHTLQEIREILNIINEQI